MSKRHEKREREKRRSRWKLRRKGSDDGYTHNGLYAGAAFVAVFLALVVGIIEVMGRWANGASGRGQDRALHGQRLPGEQGLSAVPAGPIR